MPRTLLLPCAGKSSRYPGTRPKWMLTLPEGDLALARAAASLPPAAYDRTIIAVRGEHEAKYQATALLRRVFGDTVEVLVLERDTRGPAETVAEMIRRAGVTGAFAVKDADSFFDPAPLPDGSFVALSDVRCSPQMTNVGAKSFAVINENNLVVEMVEKSLASNFVSVGLYGFADAAAYLGLFDGLAGDGQECFVSHVMNRGIAAGMPVSPLIVSGLIDVGTLEDWRRHVRPRGTIVADLDGVVFENHSRYFAPFWTDADQPIAANVEALRRYQEDGAQLIFMTARPEAFRDKTEATLRGLGLDAHALIMDCRHGRRFLINDHAPSNPHPAAVPGDVVNLERPLAAGGRLGGHFVQGHVDGVGRVTQLASEGNNWWLSVSIPEDLRRYVAEKGSIAIDGISLTVARWKPNPATASLLAERTQSAEALAEADFAIIPFTYEETNVRSMAAGNAVNLEVDILAKYVESLLAQRGASPTHAKPAPPLMISNLREQGF